MAESTINIVIQTLKRGTGDKDTKSALKQLNSMFQQATGFSLSYAGAATAAVAIGKKVYEELKKNEEAANESAITDAKLEAVLKSTNYAAGMYNDQLDELATTISRASGLDDELVKSGEAVLLTFTQIGKKVFPETMQAAVDMSAVLGQDLQSSLKMIGKAMNDFTGYTALKRAGVSFTEEQMKQIENYKKSNDLIDYQNLILGELQREYGGAAAAINKASDGQNDLQVAIENWREESGKDLPAITRVWNEFCTDFYNNATAAKKETNDFKDALDELGITVTTQTIHGQKYVKYMKDGVQITGEQAKALVAALELEKDQAQALLEQADAASEANDKTQLYNGTLLSLADQYKNVSELAKNLYQNEQSLQAAEKELHDYQKSHPWDTAGIKDRQQAVDDLRAAQQQMVNEWMLNVYTQMLTADGDLSEADMQFLLDFQVQTGMIDQATADRAKAYYDYAQQVIESNGKMQASIDALHGKDISVTVKVNYQAGTATVNGMGVANVEQTNGNGNSGQGYNYDEKKALGGDVTAGIPVLVGEKGPEVYIPREDGVIIPNGDLSNLYTTNESFGGGSIGQIIININGANDPNRTADLVMAKIERNLSLQKGRR